MHTQQGKVRLGNDSGAKLWYYESDNSSQKLSPLEAPFGGSNTGIARILLRHRE